MTNKPEGAGFGMNLVISWVTYLTYPTWIF